MNNVLRRFNTYLLALLALMGAWGCASPKSKAPTMFLRVHAEVNASQVEKSELAVVCRASPLQLRVDPNPFLHERLIESAEILSSLGGFAIKVKFDETGARVLEEYSARQRGSRFAIFGQFGPTSAEGRWLAAPVISQMITNGVLLFTPDATREEAEKLTTGLNQQAETERKQHPYAY